ncbi:phosphocarrier protein [Melghirimyces algeriensis]|uniref:Phosphocarrier protein HPr n=2 Tax=Melghirimyces algeriensis TaxID=910412 RepID=A0A521E1I1_9BACL|nr:HPr family phosphocarrier protein [Melghirimyces algeriensis]SMO77829.1 phosphocarrier protein [Melghirimyces algeriensis]
MYQENVIIQNESGLHARPAALLVKEAGNFSSEIQLVKNGKEANAKSLLGLMSLSIQKGDEITLKAEGEDAEKAVTTLRQLIESGFNE